MRTKAGVVAGVVAATVGAGAVLVLTGSSDAPEARGRPTPEAARDGSLALPVRTGRLTIDDEPATYRIVYRVDSYSGGERLTTRDEVAVARPFDGRTVKRDGPAAGDAVRSEQWGALGRLFVPKTKDAEGVLLGTGPALAPSDVRIGPVLADLEAAGRVQPREWRRVAGRACQVLRFGGPISSGTVAEELDPAVEYADACVSEDGLVLEELWVEGGRVQRRRLAESVRTGGEPVAFPTTGLPGPVPVEEGGGSFRPVDPTSSYAAPFWVLDAPPLGEHLGRWAAVTPAASDPNDQETKDRRLGSVVDVWQAGNDVVVVEQGSTAGGVKAFPLGSGARVTVDGLGEGEVVLDLRTSELRFARPGGYFVRVRGTVSAARLGEIARALRQTPGGSGLVYLDGR